MTKPLPTAALYLVQVWALGTGPSQGLQGSGSEGQQRRGGTAPVNLPHLPLGFPDLHLHLMQQDADEGILVDQPRSASP